METMGVTPTMPLYAGNDNMGESWFWIILILLFAGRGFGFGGGVETGVQNNFIENEFLKRDIFNTNANVSAQGCATQKEIIESRYTNQLGLQNLGSQMAQCCCDLKSEGFKNTCDVLNAIHADGEATRALINAQAMQDLRDRLADRDRELMTANFQLSQQAQSANIIDTLQPTPKPAYITCSPYFAYGYNPYGCGCNNL